MTITDYFTRTPVITIATTTADGREITTPIWGVIADGVPYIRNGYGANSLWYRRLTRAGQAEFLDGAARYPVRAELIDDDTVKAAVDEAYRAKYRGQGIALRQVVDRPARDYTIRLVPQGETR